MKYVCRCCKQLKEIEDNFFKKGYEKECPDCRRKHVNKFICPFCGRKMNNRTHLKSCKNNSENNWSEEPQFFEDGKKFLKEQKIKFICKNCNQVRIMRFVWFKKDFLEKCGNCIRKEKKLNYEKNLTKEQKENRVEKRKQTCLKKYGVENGGASSLAKEKIMMFWKNITEEEQERMNELHRRTCLEKYGVSSWNQTMLAQQKRRKHFKLGDLYFDSKPELAYFLWCKDSKIECKRSSAKLEYEFENKKHFYFPDFEIIQNDEKFFVEIKGKHFFKKDGTMCNPFDHSLDGLYEAKHQCMIKNSVIIFTEFKPFLENLKNHPEINFD